MPDVVIPELILPKKAFIEPPPPIQKQNSQIGSGVTKRSGKTPQQILWEKNQKKKDLVHFPTNYSNNNEDPNPKQDVMDILGEINDACAKIDAIDIEPNTKNVETRQSNRYNQDSESDENMNEILEVDLPDWVRAKQSNQTPTIEKKDISQAQKFHTNQVNEDELPSEI